MPRREYNNSHKRSLDVRRCIMALEQSKGTLQQIHLHSAEDYTRLKAEQQITVIDNVLRTVNRSVQSNAAAKASNQGIGAR